MGCKVRERPAHRCQLFDLLVERCDMLQRQTFYLGARASLIAPQSEQPFNFFHREAEATSALDTKTEDAVVRAIKALRGHVTLIAVAHRISTIKDYDQICYLDHGRILGKGTFSELAAAVPQFGLQVQLAGLGEYNLDNGLTS